MKINTGESGKGLILLGIVISLLVVSVIMMISMGTMVRKQTEQLAERSDGIHARYAAESVIHYILYDMYESRVATQTDVDTLLASYTSRYPFPVSLASLPYLNDKFDENCKFYIGSAGAPSHTHAIFIYGIYKSKTRAMKKLKIRFQYDKGVVKLAYLNP